MIKRLYPDGKAKAFNITYDDGILQDVRFVALLNKYGLKGTFNLNSQLMEEKFSWIHPNSMSVTRLGVQEVLGLYDGHEIASHTLTHPDLRDRSDEALAWEIGEDKRRLEALFGREVAGFGVPFHYYDQRVADCIRRCGFEYGRNSELTHCYSPWEDPYFWRCGIFHLEPQFDAYMEEFFRTEEELALCQIVGHSYDLDAENMWDKMEGYLARIAADPDVVSLTHLELVRYLKAMNQAVVTDHSVENRSGRTLWFAIEGQTVPLEPGQRCVIFNKLVRDKIPAVISQAGAKPFMRKLDAGDYTASLHRKLDEEVAEFHEAGNGEELADILEVLLALAADLGISPEELKQIYEKKHGQRGGFQERLLLICRVDECL
jgi:predicted house-cleaning noncanonical NTP pyrophosphatase (MazG superfamily)